MTLVQVTSVFVGELIDILLFILWFGVVETIISNELNLFRGTTLDLKWELESIFK